jgi:hypothetical protein
MSNFFMWGGFVFCALYHVISYLFILSPNNTREDGTFGQHMTNLGLSGIGLCYFGMQAFG